MKKTKYIIGGICAFALAFTSCNDDFMERYPQSQISPENYFKTVADLQLYTNSYYFAPEITDGYSDNVVDYASQNQHKQLIQGILTEDIAAGWSGWNALRRYNLLLKNATDVNGDQAEVKHYIGLTRLMRAQWYYNMVMLYNEVPWYDEPLTDDDEAALTKGRDSRETVVAHVMEDLNYATENMKTDYANRTKMSKWYALYLKAHICLTEGSWRKYHDELGLQSSANKFFEEAANAANQIIQSGKFSIDKTGGAAKAYQRLFTSYNNELEKSPEIILFKDYSKDLGILHGAPKGCFDNNRAFSRSLMESYDYIENGEAKPFTSVEGYDKMGFVEVFQNRDPRMSQTIMPPGYMQAGYSKPNVANMELGGYANIKYMTDDNSQNSGWSSAYNDIPICRYAEVLLIYAEAQAELGSFTQKDMDITLNAIRARVDMPGLKVDNLPTDKNLEALYPTIADNKLLQQIRRERRIELVDEGKRWDDIIRWKEGHLLAEIQEGIYVSELGAFDVTGDGVADVGIYTDKSSVPSGAPSVKYYLSGAIGLTGTDKGYIVIKNEIGRRFFKEPQYYYMPIPKQQLILNPNLGQTKYW